MPSDGSKNPGGRPSKLPKIDTKRVETLAKKFLTDEQFAAVFEISTRTWNRWKKKNEKFCQSLKMGKAEADEKVQKAFHKKAIGFTIPTEKVFLYEGQIIRAKTKTYYPPDTAAGYIWLKNRKAHEWSDNPVRPDQNKAKILEWLDGIPEPDE